ncbi:hypothetical protein ACTXT7_016935 [Hymenolepis weldensis]
MGTRRALLSDDGFHVARGSVSTSGAIVQPEEIKVSPCRVITTPTLPVAQMSLAEMDSLISPFIRRRADEFTREEINLLIEEIGKLRHILLSKAPQHSRLKKKAWEEVASNLALRFPNGPKRLGTQLKKKWENIVLRTRRRLRDGLLTQEMERNECLRMVVQFLVEANQAKLRVEESEGMAAGASEQTPMEYPNNPPNSSLFGAETMANLADVQGTVNAATNGSNVDTPIESLQNVQIKRDVNETAPPSTSIASNAGTQTATTSTDVSSEEEEGEDGPLNGEDNTRVHVSANANGCPDDGSKGADELYLRRRRKKRMFNRELVRQSRAEHELRVKILDMKHRYWQLKFDSLKRRISQEEQQQ